MNKKLVFITLVFIFFFFTGQNIYAEGYKLNINDQIYISVWGYPELQQKAAVGPDGTISFPLIGAVRAEGLTVNELGDKIKGELSKYIKNPEVNISLLTYRESRVMVIGAVNRPGTYQLVSGQRILDIISLAGGIGPTGDMSSVMLTRGDEVIKIDLESMLTGEKDREDKNYLLEDGDVLYIPESTVGVTILGEVKQPGRYKIKKGLRLSDLLAMAGSLTEKAELTATYTSEDSIRRVNLEALLAGDMEENPVLKEGDSVFVPQTSYQVTVAGKVNKPGIYPWNKGLRLADIMARAGNHTEQGNIKKVKVIHQDGSSEYYDFEKYIFQNLEEENPLLRPGDNVFIAEHEKGSRVTVLGEVNNPGTYPWDRNLHLTDLLARAGNQTEKGNLEDIKIIHGDGSYEQVNLEEYFSKNIKENNPLLERGDIVLVNESDSIDWEKVFFFVGGFNAIKDLLEIDW